MATAVQSPATFAASPLAWFEEFLKQELAPYEGRVGTVARMTFAATLVMIVCMTFRISYAWQGAIYALLISRESIRATLQSMATMFVVTAIGITFILLQAYFAISFPLLHFVSNIATLFVAFYAVSALTDYTAAVAFANTIAAGIPFWDRHVSAETNVEDTLRLVLAVLVGVAITAAVELVFTRRRPGDEVVSLIAERLAAVGNVLTCYAEGRAADPSSEQKIIRFGMLGTSLIRRSLRRSDYSAEYSIEAGGIAALVGRLVDLAASLTQVDVQPSISDRKRFQNLTAALATIRQDLINRTIPAPVQFNRDEQSSGVAPLLSEMEHTATLIPQAFSSSGSIHDYLPTPDDLPRRTLLAPDAFANPAHVRFALSGCLAASICYIIYNAIDWPGISTAVTTCMLTALTTIGSSRQKQFLRLTGATFGGFVLGMGSQIFILPYLDSIAGFVVLFVAVTAFSAWIMTSSPRLSYFGVQVALAFYLINLNEFKMQISLAVARDRVVGVLLGLFIMWLVFDQLWSAPAGVEIRRAFISNLRLIAQFAREPLATDLKASLARNLALRETITTDLDKVRALGDSILFEFGPSRAQDLALRDRIRQWQTHLRMLFIALVVLWRYRLRLSGFELPEAIYPAEEEFDKRLATALDGIADRIDGKGSTKTEDLTSAYAQLEQASSKGSPNQQHQFASQIQSFLLLSRRIAGLADLLTKEI
jgi:multidrug resistance protein MdtO